MRHLLRSNGAWIALILACVAPRAFAQFDAMGRPVSPLQRKLPSIVLPHVKLDSLADVFAKVARTPVRVPWDSKDFNRDMVFSVYLHDCSVDSAIHAALGSSARMVGSEIVVNDPAVNGPIVRIQYPVEDLARLVSPLPGEGEQELLKLIEDFVLVESWKDNGGADGDIHCGLGFLVVDQTLGAHIEVQNALDGLRSAIKRNKQPVLADLSPAANVLESPVGAAKFNEAPFGKVIEQLAKQTGANLVINWSHLETAGIGEDSPITVDVTGVPLGTACGALLRCSGEALDFAMIDGIILIDTKEHLHRRVEIRTYDIGPLLKNHTEHRRNTDGAITRQDAIGSVTRALEDNVATEEWKDNGGAIGSIRVMGDIAVVQSSMDTHQKIDRFFADFADALADPRIANVPKPLPKIPGVKIGTVVMNDIPLKDAFAQLETKTASRLIVNWRYLEAAGIDRNRPVTLRVNNATLKSALTAVLSAGGGSTHLSAVPIYDHVVEITTEESLSHREQATRFYQVRPLIDALLAHQTGAFNRLETPTTEAAMDLICRAIESHVNPESWRDNGGAVAALHPVSNVLIITALPQMQQQVEEILPRMKHEADFGYVSEGGR